MEACSAFLTEWFCAYSENAAVSVRPRDFGLGAFRGERFRVVPDSHNTRGLRCILLGQHRDAGSRARTRCLLST